MFRRDLPSTLVAQLPDMTSADLVRFEKEGGVWGQQRTIRRKQVTVALGCAAAATIGGALWTYQVRRNTLLLTLGTSMVWTTFGAVTGNAVGQLVYPSVASNKETTLMRRVWWAKECSKGWDLRQVTAEKWSAVHPNSTLLQKS